MSAGLGAIVLAGGRGSRFGGQDKAGLSLGGERLVDRVVTAARAAGAERIVVAGPQHAVPAGCIAVREDPPYGGPLAALAAALPALSEAAGAADALLLSCDLVRPVAVARLLSVERIDENEDAVVLRDPEGRAQWLAGRYRLAALLRGVGALGRDLAHRPLRHAFTDLMIRFLDADARAVADIDTPDDLIRARSETMPGSEPAIDSVPALSEGAPVSQPNHLPPEALDAWLAAAAAELGLTPDAVRIGTVLDLARDVAHDVARPAAPLSTFLLGLAYGRVGGADADQLAHLADRLTARAAAWKAERED